MTPKQLKCYHFIRDYIAQHGYAPSFREIAGGIGTASISKIGSFLETLAQEWLLEYAPDKARSIRLTDLKSKMDFLRVVYGREAVRAEVMRWEGRE